MTGEKAAEPVNGAGANGAGANAAGANGAGAPDQVDTHATGGTGRSVRLKVARRKRGETKTRFQTYEVEAAPETTVLDALVAIRRDQDPSLVLRHSCYHASCGTCGMRVDDREVLACVTRLADLGETVKVEPIANQTLVADLATDMLDFYDRFRAAQQPLIRASEYLPEAARPEGVEEYTRLENCIECGLCLSACPIVSSDSRYLGPAALGAAQRVVAEPRGTDTFSILRLVDDPQAAWRCHEIFECTAVCPSNVDPAGKIMLLRRRLTSDRIKTLFGRRRA